ncbi:D-serine ammonia-lyase [Peptoniphilus sp. KCTC 25270]|uniref:D-serine ammonia-lyase n=1 Tax=Peptoniphilus sp. KCTC 25270 TaxID=2897414 RepID=UPI001E4FED25|nr:D-serine ammonia-lyase [Peptoniphilus sp. KCTC 25270]MCD1147878.1 D-serine ammonia-lyase [Peptoniphilus sp. KCTC 25270]
MLKKTIEEQGKKYPELKEIIDQKEVFWINPKRVSFQGVEKYLPVSKEEVEEAEARLQRFAPFIEKVFPETKERGGIIESPLAEISQMKESVGEFPGSLWLKMDSHLAVAGSVKARGGIYEVLKRTEILAKEHGLLEDGDYGALADPENRKIFENYTIQVGSTGNLGLSIGISSAKIGFKVIVHMSADAKQWKKDLLRSHGVTVKEYESNYSLAVEQGRKESDADPKSHFVDDENSVDLFMGYAVAAKRLQNQLKENKIVVDESRPLCVYIPCGVGGAPGGIAYGLKSIFQENVHIFFIEPTHAPCMILGMVTELHDKIAVEDVGIDGKTEADGLAVGRPSGFVGKIMDPILDGLFTIEDDRLFPFLQELYKTEDIFIEPSAAASFQGVYALSEEEKVQEYFEEQGLGENTTHICWATGGALVPEEMKKEYLGQ